jgi:hypothetical protein
MIFNLKVELIITLFLTLLCSTIMGLAISTLVTNNDRAMSVVPFFLIPQIIFSGFVFKLSGISDRLSDVIIAKWSLRSLGVSLKLNELPLRMMEDNRDNTQLYTALKQIKRNVDSAYNHDISRLYKYWCILGLIALCCILVSFITLTLREKK